MIDRITSDSSIPSDPLRIVAISAGTGEPSSSRMLSDRIVESVTSQLEFRELLVTAQTIELRGLAVDVARGIVGGGLSEQLQEAIDDLATADAVVVSTPIYKAGVSGIFKTFIDLLDNDLLIAKPVILAATAGSPRHALVADGQLRSLFAYLRTFTTPTSLVATPDDWSEDDALTTRVDRAAAELAALVTSDVSDIVIGGSWSHYRHASVSGG